MITVTLFKLRGNKAADDFRGCSGHRGDALSEWDYLTLDKRLKIMGVKFVVKDYQDVKLLPVHFGDKIKTPIYLNLHYGESYANSSPYPEGAGLDAGSIRQWIMTAIKKIAPEKLSVAENLHSLNDLVSPSVPAVVDSSATKAISPPVQNIETPAVKDEKKPVTETDVQESVGGLFKLGLGIGGTLLVAALAITGVAVGSLAADNFNRDGDDDLASSGPGGDDEYPLFIETITGGKMDFAKIWEERAPSFLKSKPKTTQEVVKIDKPMDTPLPNNIQNDNNSLPIKSFTDGSVGF